MDECPLNIVPMLFSQILDDRKLAWTGGFDFALAFSICSKGGAQ
jgi:hypothetical protein